MESQVRRIVRSGSVVLASVALVGLLGCGGGGGGDGAGAASGPTSGQTPSSSPVTQSDIVLPSSVQVVTAK